MPVTEFRSDMRLGLCTSSETSNKPFFSCWAALPRPVKLLLHPERHSCQKHFDQPRMGPQVFLMYRTYLL
jgi:hypothetical protein